MGLSAPNPYVVGLLGCVGLAVGGEFGAEGAEDYALACGEVGVEFETGTLEPLGEVGLTVGRVGHVLGRGDGPAEDALAAVVAPEVEEVTCDFLPGGIEIEAFIGVA